MYITPQKIFTFLLFIYGVLCDKELPESTPYDGWYNNPIHPDWGAIDGQLLRKSLPAYSDGVYHMAGQNRPNPFVLSKTAHKGTPGQRSSKGRNALMVYFGQQVVEEILDAQRPGCPREFENIPVPKDHKLYNPEQKDDLEMPFLRSRYDSHTGYSPNNPRQQLNEITPFIDGTLFYGPAKAWTDAIRSFKNGTLKATDESAEIKDSFPAKNDIRLPFANPPPPRDHTLSPVKRFLTIGNPRGNENPFLLSFAILFFRLHNHLCEELATKNHSWNDEILFNEARRRVIAHHQKIVMYDWLPAWLQIDNNNEVFKMPPYSRNDNDSDTAAVDCGQFCGFNGYNMEIHPGITQEFQTAAMRYGHTLVTPGAWLRGPNSHYPNGTVKCDWKVLPKRTPGPPEKVHALRLCNSYWKAQETVEPQLDDLIRGMTSTYAEKEDHIMVPDLREHVFGPLEFSRRDLGAINIQRGRDHGLPGYNEVREAYGLKRNSWRDINPHLYDNSSVIQNVAILFGNTSAPDQLDLFSGGLLETTDAGPGELFRTIMLEQFLRIRHGDRFWFENSHPKFKQFSPEDITQIKNTTLRDIILTVTRVKPEEIPDNVFILDELKQESCPQVAQLVADSDTKYNNILMLENCTRPQHYDYFSGSEVSFSLSFVCLGLCVPGCIGIMILMVKRRQKEIREARRKLAPKGVKSEDANTFKVVEWVGPNTGERVVKVKFDSQRRKILVTDTRRKPLRMIDLRRVTKSGRIHFRLANDGERNLISVRVPNDIDLVLRFIDEDDKSSFIRSLEDFLRELGINRENHEFSEKSILDMADTKEERQKVLDNFFRVICLQAFKKTTSEMKLEKLSAEEVNKIQMIQLSRTEFADALGLKPNSIFVRNMFLMVDTTNSGSVGFQEFLDMFIVLASGDADDKAHMIFNMYDVRKRGYLTKEEFIKMIKSLLDLSDSAIDDSKLATLIKTMYETAGLSENDNMTFDPFKKIFASDEYARTLEKATLGVDTLQQTSPKDKTTRQSKRQSFFQSYRMKNKRGPKWPPYGKVNELVCTQWRSIWGQPPCARLLYNDQCMMTKKDWSKRVIIKLSMDDRALTRKNTRVRVKTKENKLAPTVAKQRLYEFVRWFENYRLQVFWVTLYTLVTLGIFAERAYYYSINREHKGLRRIAGYGVTVTRGAASGMMWTYSCLLVTMSRNTLTFLRETFFHRFIPFDSAHAFHKYIAAWALFFTVMHCVGHGINLYHICTQSSIDLNCVFREYFRATDVLASFHYWAYTTITGITGIILTVIVIVMYVFAVPYARRNLFTAFWFTHNFYILLYIFMILHGLGRLVQSPIFANYFYGPMVVYVLDKLVSLSRNKREVKVFQAELLPSDVTALKFKRPLDFEYRSGQWVRIACETLGAGEYHPFTLTSAPHEDFLSLHIRAVGPWTMNLRSTYDPNHLGDKLPPNLFLDGPFGEGHQDWYKFPIAVLVGGGIGVTPFTSILKDIIFKSQNQSVHFPCKKVYFLWVTRTQKQFEWVTDIIRDVENADTRELVSVHIFITQFQQKFDLRTTMLYICERHFQKIAGKSLFTGLGSKTHFGRPKFEDFLVSLHMEHPEVKNIGVFSCGPPPMTLKVDKACSTLNKYQDYPSYSHHFENF